MSVTGIIAEFNPLHTGHEYLIKTAKKSGQVVCVISGNFVQRGDTAIAEKRVRAEAALLCGADLVLELPFCWSMSTAGNFALGGVSVLENIGCDRLLFGSECGDISKLERACNILESENFRKNIRLYLDTGMTFAAAREKAAAECGLEKGILSGANNNLAIEYMMAGKALNSKMTFSTVERLGTQHDSQKYSEKFASASLLRKKVLSGDAAFCEKYLPHKVKNLFLERNVSDIGKIETAILAILRTKTLSDLSNLPDISEGLENKLFSAIRIATGLEELYNMVKVKRYTHARIRRMVLSAAIGIDDSFFMKPPPYIRVLGFGSEGEKLLRNNISKSSLPVILRAGDIKQLPLSAQRVFEWECRATDIYSLSLLNPQPCGLEYTSKLIKVE